MTTTALAGASAPAAGRKVTPTGRLILPADADRAAWLTARRSGIGSSDIAAILGISRYGNALSVWHDKTGGLPLESDDSEPALWGRAFEETVAREWARRNRSVVRRVGLVAHIDRPWEMCTLDRRVLECPLADGREKCAVEIKCRDKMKAGQFRRGVADDVLVQTLWQAIACGFDHVHAAVLIGGNDYRQFVIRVADHAQLVGDLRAAGERAWQQIADRRPPVLAHDADPDVLLDLYGRLHPERAGTVDLTRDVDTQEAVEDYLDAHADLTAAEKRKKAAKARILAGLGGAEAATVLDKPYVSLDERSKEWTDTKRLAERWPDAYADCVEDRSYRQISIPRSVREEHNA
ncbi:YqaJ viral recombinase family nuclease [Streptomyces acidiscabies]|uniref:YqaJ viral recombinase family nuclease n=1 Tax=Streptomyces acidiscabies TaxID=42234 RepID=UPI00073E4F51|nr:YqaJ viral recombinase family protein [Streptomyces acidiscabies]GAQ52118.1 YqaJ-like viral recombinase domain protein [Streptomyces acidiscabies]